MTASDIMTRSVRTVPEGAHLAEAMAIMDSHGISQVPVMRGDSPVAMLTEDDARHALMQRLQDRPVERLASPLPDLLGPDSRISEVLQALQGQNSLLVVGDDGALAGIITYWDVVVLARPHLFVKEVELLLRLVVAAQYERKYGDNWWGQVPEEIRQRAEQEHQADRAEFPNPTPEHMLGHTSFWGLIETFRSVRPDLEDSQFTELHRIREFRNKVAHYALLTPDEQRTLVADCLKAGAWLERFLHD
jgi:hypothetical protein